MTDPDPIRELIEAIRDYRTCAGCEWSDVLRAVARLDAAIAAVEEIWSDDSELIAMKTEDQAILDSWAKTRRPRSATKE